MSRQWHTRHPSRGDGGAGVKLVRKEYANHDPLTVDYNCEDKLFVRSAWLSEPTRRVFEVDRRVYIPPSRQR